MKEWTEPSLQRRRRPKVSSQCLVVVGDKRSTQWRPAGFKEDDFFLDSRWEAREVGGASRKQKK